jgi:hypothetical protein
VGQGARGAQGPDGPMRPGPEPNTSTQYPESSESPEWTESRCGRQLWARHRTMVVTATRLRMS